MTRSELLLEFGEMLLDVHTTLGVSEELSHSDLPVQIEFVVAALLLVAERLDAVLAKLEENR